jgi:hypothetical protein
VTTTDYPAVQVIDVEFVETPGPAAPPPMPAPKLGEITPGVQTRFTVDNPHRVGLFFANVVFIGSGIGTVLAVARDDTRADLAFLMVILSLALIGWQTCRYNAYANNPPQSAFRKVS